MWARTTRTGTRQCRTSGLSEWQTFQLLTARWLHTQYAGAEYPALWIVLRLFRFFSFTHSLSDHAVGKVSKDHCFTNSFLSVYSFSFMSSFGFSTLVIILFRVTNHLYVHVQLSASLSAVWALSLHRHVSLIVFSCDSLVSTTCVILLTWSCQKLH